MKKHTSFYMILSFLFCLCIGTILTGCGAGPAAETTEASDDFYAVWSNDSKDVVETFAKEVKETILAEDWDKLSGFCLYPVNISGKAIKTPEEFIETMNKAQISTEFMDAVKEESCENMFANSEGSMFGNGEVWISCRKESDDSEDLKMGVIALNY